jgi:hypothetical protein
MLLNLGGPCRGALKAYVIIHIEAHLDIPLFHREVPKVHLLEPRSFTMYYTASEHWVTRRSTVATDNVTR